MNPNIPNQIISTTNFKGEEINISKEYFKQKVEAMLMGGAIGDALGIPVEMKTKEYIESNYGRLDKYIDSSLNTFFNKGGLSTGKIGMISDDSILTFSGVESIIETGMIDFNNLMKHSIKAYKSFPYGFGGATRNSFAKYEELEKESPGNNNYINLGGNESAGNGVIMKQSPFAAYLVAKNINDEDIDKNIELLSKLTHGHQAAIVASLVHNKFLMELLKTNNEIDLIELLENIIKYSKKIEKKLLEEGNDKISELLEKLLKDQNNGGLQSYDEILNKYGWGDKKIFSSGYVVTTIGIVYSIFLNKQNFEGLLDTINIGGDVDTFGAIIGNMIGAYKGKFYENKYIDGLEDKERLLVLSREFGYKITKKEP